MSPIMVAIITAIASVLGSNGVWAFIQSRKETDTAEHKALMGLLHNRICDLSEKYIVRGYVLEWEFEDLVDYIYKPYKSLGGNGTAEKLINEVKKLPIYRDIPAIEKGGDD